MGIDIFMLEIMKIEKYFYFYFYFRFYIEDKKVFLR